MWRFIQQSGPFILLQGVLALAVLILAVVNTVRLAIRDRERVAGLTRSIDAILFWGSLTAIFGFLGQWSGIYKAANALADYGVADPKLVVLGFGESLGTSVFGLFALVVAAFLWFGLRVAQHWRATI